MLSGWVARERNVERLLTDIEGPLDAIEGPPGGEFSNNFSVGSSPDREGLCPSPRKIGCVRKRPR